MLKKLLVLTISTFVFFFNINSFPLRNWDEAWYAEIIKNMASGKYNLLFPFWNGQYYFDKPPLYFWLSLPFFKVFGPGEWETRIVSVIASIGATFLIYLVAKRLFNPATGIFSSLIFVTLGQVYVRFSHGNLDALLVFSFLITFYFYLLSKDKRIFLPLCGIFLGLGFLIKGWFLGLFPLFIIFVYAFLKERRSPKNLVLILAFSVLSSGWWYLLGFLKFGKPFVNWYLFTIAEGGLNTPFFSFSLHYFNYFLRDFGVWLVPILLFAILRKRISRADQKTLFFLIFSAFSFIFVVNFLKEKADWHILPAYPFVAIIAGYFVGKMLEKYFLKILLLIILLVGIQLFIVYKIENIYPDRSSVGAQLGIYGRNILKGQDIAVLDDRDFTSFLYYSNQQTIYVVRDEGPTDKRDWWILKYGDLPYFLERSKRAIIITKDARSLPIQFDPKKIIGEYDQYRFIRFE